MNEVRLFCRSGCLCFAAHASGGHAAANGGDTRLYLPKWSDETLREVTKNMIAKLNKTPEQAARRESVLRQHFPESLVEGYGPLMAAMTNEPKDRHVLASAVASGAKLIVTYNARDFPKESLEPYDIERQGPSTFLMGLYDLEPGIVSVKLAEQAQAINLSLEDLLRRLQQNAVA